MIDSLYWIMTLVLGFVTGLLCWDLCQNRLQWKKEEKAFVMLLFWVMFFCYQDALWGFIGSRHTVNETLFFASSQLFHLFTITTSFIWLYYVLTYLGDSVQYGRHLLRINFMCVVSQCILVGWNFFSPTIFYIENGIYYTAWLRPLAFANQYILYVSTLVMALVHMRSAEGIHRKKYRNVFLFSLAPCSSGFFQVLYPDGPFYSIGYFVGIILIFLFVVARDKEELVQLQNELERHQQILKLKTDSLTGIGSRFAYEEYMSTHGEQASNPNFVYLTIDINDLKRINDDAGHNAGDELLIGAANCMRQVLYTYGNLYRIGGDEFAALIFADKNQVRTLIDSLKTLAIEWKGTYEQPLSFSVGAAFACDCKDCSMQKLAKIADERMYQDKAKFYSERGLDRRAQQSAFNAICSSYNRIMKINLSDGTFHSIRSVEQGIIEKENRFSDSIFQILYNFAVSGNVHPKDVESFKTYTSKEYLREFFRQGNKNLNIFYRRKQGDEYRQMKMEILPAEDYRADNQSVYLFAKDIDK